MLVDYLKQAGATCRVIRNTASIAEITAEPYDAVVLSPGPGTPRQAGVLMQVIAHYYQQLPVLGVCLGHQALGEFFGARLEKASQPMHGKCSTVQKVGPDPLLDNLPASFAVTRYHSLVLDGLPDSLVPILETQCKPAEGSNRQTENMAFRHAQLPIWGVQFHPEAALTQFGLEILKNWITFVKRAI